MCEHAKGKRAEKIQERRKIKAKAKEVEGMINLYALFRGVLRSGRKKRENEGDDKFISTKITITTHFFTSPVSLTCFHCLCRGKSRPPNIQPANLKLLIIMNPANDFTLVYFFASLSSSLLPPPSPSLLSLYNQEGRFRFFPCC
jgi:hypothetical protein